MDLLLAENSSAILLQGKVFLWEFRTLHGKLLIPN